MDPGSERRASVSTIASKFTGASRAQPEQVFQAGYLEQQAQGKRAAQDADSLRKAYHGKGDDLMTEFERNRRLEAEARRRAELEALNNLHRYVGSHALILAYCRAKLGLPLSESERKLLQGSSTKLQLTVQWTAAQIEEERARALAYSLQQDEAAVAAAGSGPSREGSLFAHSLQAETPAGTPTGDAPPRGRPLPEAPQPSSETTPEMRALLKLIAAILQAEGHALTLGDISAAIAAKTGKKWGAVFEPRHGPLLRFLGTQPAREQGILVAHNKYALLEGMPDPSGSSPPTILPATAASTGTATNQEAFTLSRGVQAAAPVVGVGGYGTEAVADAGQWSPFDTRALAVHQQLRALQFAAGQGQSESYGGRGGAVAASESSHNPFEDDAFFDPIAATRKRQQEEEEAAREAQDREAAAATVAAALADARYKEQLQAAQQRARLTSSTSAGITSTTTQRPDPHNRVLSSDAFAFAVETESNPYGETTGVRRTTRTKMVTETEQGVEIRPPRTSRASLPGASQSNTSAAPSGGAPSWLGSSTAQYPIAPIVAPPPQPYSMAHQTFDSFLDGRRGPGDYGQANRSGSELAATTSRPVAASTPQLGGGALSSSSSGYSLRATNDADAERLAQRALERNSAVDSTSDDNLAWNDFDILFKPMLLHGFNLVKHGRSGTPKRRHMWFNNALTKLFWDTSRIIDVLRTGERHIDIADVVSIIDGVGTAILQRKAGRGEVHTGNQDKFFSLITTTRTYDFEAASVAQKKVLVRAINFLIRHLSHPALRGTQTLHTVSYRGPGTYNGPRY